MKTNFQNIKQLNVNKSWKFNWSWGSLIKSLILDRYDFWWEKPGWLIEFVKHQKNFMIGVDTLKNF